MRTGWAWKVLAWGVLLLLFGSGFLLVGVRRLRPREPDLNAWFPMRVGDRWTYADPAIPDRVVFEAVGREPGGRFRIERRIGGETVTFVLSVTPSSVWIHTTSRGEFDVPFEEFRMPPVEGAEWAYEGRFGGQPLKVVSRVERVEATGSSSYVEESSISGRTTFVMERGKGVVRLKGKGDDPHGFGRRIFDWTLEKFERRG